MNSPSDRRGNRCPLDRDLNPVLVSLDGLKPIGRETRKHPSAQIQKLQASLVQFGFVLPIVVDGNNQVVAGWALVQAAKKLGLTDAPVVIVADLDEAQLRLLRLTLNRLSEDASWNIDELKLEFADILEIDPQNDLRLSGFEMGEIDMALGGGADDEEDELPKLSDGAEPKTKPGDLWVLGEHRLLCADALVAENYDRLLEGEPPQLVFTDPPWNIPIEGNVSGLGATKHANFVMGCGEMTAAQFETFLAKSLGHAAAHSVDGAIQFVCMHWSRMSELLDAAATLSLETKNLCVWNKSNAGMGSLYRSKHELIFVFKKGAAPHINNVELGRFGRHRANVWDYPGQNFFNNTAKSKLAVHPTPKPVALVADAIRDCSDRGGIVLDPFGGAGSTLIAAEKTGRRARLIEIDPRYVDVIVQRWEHISGKSAIRVELPGSFLGDSAASDRQPVPTSIAVPVEKESGSCPRTPKNRMKSDTRSRRATANSREAARVIRRGGRNRCATSRPMSNGPWGRRCGCRRKASRSACRRRKRRCCVCVKKR